MSDLAALGTPPTFEDLAMRRRDSAATGLAAVAVVYGAVNRDWSAAPTAQAYVDAVRLQGRQLVREEVDVLNDHVWYSEAAGFGARAGLFGAAGLSAAA